MEDVLAILSHFQTKAVTKTSVKGIEYSLKEN